MATRKKHLINVHTSTGTTAPTAADLRLGEIAVQHTSENPAIWIKMGNAESSAVYEKFIGKTEITNMFEDSKILGSGYTYSGIPYVNSSTTIADAYSALTNETILNEKVMAEALNDLNTRIEDLSAATEDIGGIESITMNGNTYTGTSVNLGTVVTAETQLSTAVTGTGNVVTNLTVSGHKITMDKAYSAAPADQFVTLSGAAHNKITSLSAGTIALVGSSAASVFSSAKTYTDSEIAKLDSTGHTSDSGHYLTSVTITDGIITAVGEQPVPGETDITTATSGNGNVISNLTVTGHQITMVKEVTAATSAQVSTLSAATHAHVTNGDIHVTAAQKTAWTNGSNSGASAYTGVTQLSGVVESLEDEVAKIAVTAVTVSGTGNAVVAATYSNSALTLGKGDVQAVITDLATIRSNAASGMQAYNDVRSLSAATTGISQTLNTVSGAAHNKITALSAATTVIGQGLSNLSAATLSAVTAKGDNYIDASVSSRSAITVTTKKSVVTDLSTAISTTGSLADAKAIKTYIDNTLSSTVTYKGATASLPSNPAVGDMWVAASAFTAGGQSVEVGDFVIARTSGASAQWDVIEKNLDGAITGALTADTVTLGESTNSVKSLANGSNGTVLAISGNKPVWTSAVKVSSASVADNALKVNNHTVSTDVPTGAVFTDAATTEGGHYIPSKSASTEGSATGFIQQIKLDSKNHVVGIVSGSPSDTATTETGHYTPSTSANTKGTTAATTTSFIKGIRIDSKSHVIDVVTGTVVTAETKVSVTTNAAGSTAAAVVSGIASGGTLGHTLTVSKTNKIFSATTADSAVTSQSASTAADSAKLGGVAAANYSQTSHTHSQYVNQNAFGKIAVGTTTGTATAVTDTLTFSGAGATTVSIDATNRKITISSTDTKVTAVGNHYTATTATKTGGTTTATAASAVKGITYDNAGHIVGVTTGSVLTGETSVSVANGTTGNTAAAVITGITTGGTAGHALTLNKSNKVFSAGTADSASTVLSAITSLSAQTSILGPDYTYTGMPQVNSATSVGDAYSAMTEEIKKVNHNIPFVEQDGDVYTGSTADYTATCNELDELVDGQSIIFFTHQASKTGSTIAGSCTLNLTLSDGTETGPKIIYLEKNTKITTHFEGTNCVRLVYRENVSWSGVTGLSGWWTDYFYDANTNTDVLGYALRYNNVQRVDTSQMYRYRLMFSSADNKYWVPANSATSTNATAVRTPATTPINPFGPIAYYATTAVVNSAASPGSTVVYTQYSAVTLGYSFVFANSAMTAKLPLYLKCEPQGDGSAVIDPTTPVTQQLPTTEDGMIYIFLGVAVNTTVFELYEQHPVYEFKNGHLRAYQEGEDVEMILGSGYTYSGIPYVNSSTTIADAYSALTNEVIKDEKVTSAALNDLDLRIKELSGNSGGGTLTGVSAGGTEVPVNNDVAAIPSASSSVFGVVKTGSFLTNTNGTISVSTGTTSSTVARGNHTHDEYATTATLNALSAATGTHVGDSDIHVTAQQKGEWNAKQAAIPDLGQIRNNALSGASAYTRVQELSASVIANRDAISALTDSLEELSGAVWSKEFVIAMGMNDLRDKIREISGSTGGGSGSGLPAVTSDDNGKVLRVENGEWVLTRPVTVYAGTDSPSATLGTEGDIFLQIS